MGTKTHEHDNGEPPDSQALSRLRQGAWTMAGVEKQPQLFRPRDRDALQQLQRAESAKPGDVFYCTPSLTE